jgi:hypothetical protein
VRSTFDARKASDDKAWPFEKEQRNETPLSRNEQGDKLFVLVNTIPAFLCSKSKKKNI